LPRCRVPVYTEHEATESEDGMAISPYTIDTGCYPADWVEETVTQAMNQCKAQRVADAVNSLLYVRKDLVRVIAAIDREVGRLSELKRENLCASRCPVSLLETTSEK
jgi:hypothetical protein